MTLPVVPLPTGTASVGGVDVPITSLSRAAVVALSDTDDTDTAEILIISKGTGVPEAEAKAWRETVDADTADELLKAIAVISGIRKPGDKPGEA